MFLVVDDDPRERELIELEFMEDYCAIQSVRDGQEATEYLEGKGRFCDRHKFPLPDVILLDLKMPRMNGFEFLEWRKRAPAFSSIPVVMISSSAARTDVERAYALGANCYMVKPIQFAVFRSHMKALGLFWSELVETPTGSGG
jgi:CheY-like chemotaxis protein